MHKKGICIIWQQKHIKECVDLPLIARKEKECKTKIVERKDVHPHSTTSSKATIVCLYSIVGSHRQTSSTIVVTRCQQ